jgi:hypothetical protein
MQVRLDRDLDGQVSAAELAASEAAVRVYLAKHMHVIVNGASAPDAFQHVSAWRDASGFEYVEGEWSYRTPQGRGRVGCRIRPVAAAGVRNPSAAGYCRA